MTSTDPCIIEHLRTMEEYDICWKCERRVIASRAYFWRVKARDGRFYINHACTDCINGKQQDTRRRKAFGITDYHSQEYEGQFPYKAWGEKLERCGYSCAICGVVGPMSIDHIVPLSKGGGINIDNLQPLCRSCNSRKGNRL